MKALSVRQPYASLIADGRKPLEVRSWSTDYRGPLLICAAKTPHRLGHEHPERRDGPRGVALCIVELVDVRPGRAKDVALTGGIDPTGQYVWELRQPERVEELQPVSGRLGLFEIPQIA